MDARLQHILQSNISYDIFRSEIGHLYHSMLDRDFIILLMQEHILSTLWSDNQYHKALYLLAILDYTSDKYHIPRFEGYDMIRSCQLQDTLYPPEALLLDNLHHSSFHRQQCEKLCKADSMGPYFLRHNIIEWGI